MSQINRNAQQDKPYLLSNHWPIGPPNGGEFPIRKPMGQVGATRGNERFFLL